MTAAARPRAGRIARGLPRASAAMYTVPIIVALHGGRRHAGQQGVPPDEGKRGQQVEVTPASQQPLARRQGNAQQDAHVHARDGEQVRHAGLAELLNQVVGQPVPHPQQQRLAERRPAARVLRVPATAQGFGAVRTASSIARTAVALVHELDLGKPHRDADALRGEIARVVEPVELPRRKQAPRSAEAGRRSVCTAHPCLPPSDGGTRNVTSALPEASARSPPVSDAFDLQHWTLVERAGGLRDRPPTMPTTSSRHILVGPGAPLLATVCKDSTARMPAIAA